MKPFEDDLIQMNEYIQFRIVNDQFQNSFSNDLKKITQLLTERLLIRQWKFWSGNLHPFTRKKESEQVVYLSQVSKVAGLYLLSSNC